MNNAPIICRAALLLPMDTPEQRHCVEDGYVIAVGDTITEVGAFTPKIERRLRETYGRQLASIGGGESEDGIPMLSGVILPAFVKAHGHDHEQAIIGIGKELSLLQWLRGVVCPFERFIDANHETLTHELGCSPLTVLYRMARFVDIHYGITASLVHHCKAHKHHFRELAEANEAAGTTMTIALGGHDRPHGSGPPDTPDTAERRLDKALEHSTARTCVCPGPDQLHSSSAELLVRLKGWARRNGTVFHTHSCEDAERVARFSMAIEPGVSSIEFADSIGVLDERTLLAHQVHCGPRDVEILARTGACIVHNPFANAVLGSGMPPLLEFLNARIPLVISTDGSGSADNQNIIAAARLTAQYYRAFHHDPTLFPAAQLLEAITRRPARALLLNQGWLAPGAQADWIVVDLTRPNLVPTRADNVFENLIWAADGSEIDTVVARGRVLKQNRKLLPFADGTEMVTVSRQINVLAAHFAKHLASAE